MSVAIDFGTERTKLAYLDGSTPRLMVLGAGGAAHIPTLFYVGKDNAVLYGDDAAEELDHDSLGVVPVLKRKLLERSIKANKCRVTPEELLTLLFRSLRERVEREVPAYHGQKVDAVTLTTPALHGPSDRLIMERAANGAGFSSVRFVDEPVAAARAWTAATGKREDTVVVFDCGGGTIDWACLKLVDNDYALASECPPNGNNRIGGHDVDDAIIDFIQEQVENDDQAVAGLTHFRNYYVAKIRGIKESYCRTGRIAGLRIGDHPVNLDAASMDGLLRDRFIDLATHDLASYIDAVRRTLGVESPTILLVGGSSRTRGLEEALVERCHCPVARWDYADYATVLGALCSLEPADAPGEPTAAPAPEASPVPAPALPPQPEALAVALPEAPRTATVDARPPAASGPLESAWLTEGLPPLDPAVAAMPAVAAFFQSQERSTLAYLPLYEEIAVIIWRLHDPINSLGYAARTFFEIPPENEQAWYAGFLELHEVFEQCAAMPDFEAYAKGEALSFTEFACSILSDVPKDYIEIQWELGKWRSHFEAPASWKEALVRQWVQTMRPLRSRYEELRGHYRDVIAPLHYEVLAGQQRKHAQPEGFLASFVSGLKDGWYEEETKKQIQAYLSEQDRTQLLAQGYCDQVETNIRALCRPVADAVMRADIPMRHLWCEAAKMGLDLEDMRRRANAISMKSTDDSSIEALAIALSNIKGRDDVDSYTLAELYQALRRDGFTISDNGELLPR